MPRPARTIPVALLGLLAIVALPATRLAAADPSVPPPSPMAVVTTSTDPETALDLATDYVDALLSDRMADAWALLAPESHTRFDDDAARFATERRGYLEAADRRLAVGEPTQDPTLLTTSLDRLDDPTVDPGRAWVIELDYPSLAWAPSPDDVLLAAPDATGTWHLWWVR